jgi:superfamily I DNA/RNA helicase
VVGTEGGAPAEPRVTNPRTRIWTPSPGIILEPNAFTAVTSLDANVAVSAGPGAGKTELLAQRADFIFTTRACSYPKRIVAISFKVDAATNLRERVAARCKPAAAARFDSHTFHAFARHIIARHRPHVAARVPPDFRVGPGRSDRQLHYDDLLPLALEVLRKDPTAVNVIRQSYSYAFFDEFQDCTAEQYELLQVLFANSNVRCTAVGDPKQRIMGFAGALDAAMSGFVRDFHARTLPIYQNHRSLLRLRRVQNSLVKVMDPSAALPDAELGTPRVSDATPVPNDGEVFVWNFADASNEAVALAAQIQGDIEAGIRPDQIAVLVSRLPGAYCEQLVDLLTEAGIACRDEQTHQDVLAEPAAMLILDVTRLLVLRHAPQEYVRLGAFMTRNCVDEQQAARRRRRLDEFLEDTRLAISSGDIELRNPDHVRATVYAFLRVCERQYLSLLSAEYADREVLSEVANQAIASVGTAIATTPTLQAAMARLSLEDAVRIMNVHKCKGLEFEHVYFVAIENETFFDSRENIEKARPNFFVGISRARSRLVLTYASTRPVPRTPTRRWQVDRTPQREFLTYAWAQRSS